jgi:hypothetical protein
VSRAAVCEGREGLQGNTWCKLLAQGLLYA